MDPRTRLQARAQNPDSVRERESYSRRPPNPRRSIILNGFKNTTYRVHFFNGLTGTVPCRPGSQRVHMVSPMNDLSILAFDAKIRVSSNDGSAERPCARPSSTGFYYRAATTRSVPGSKYCAASRSAIRPVCLGCQPAAFTFAHSMPGYPSPGNARASQSAPLPPQEIC